MNVQHMLDNAATASQHLPIVDNPVVTGAILRSFTQWLNANSEKTIGELMMEILEHPSYGK